MMQKFWNWLLGKPIIEEEPCENDPANSAHDPQVVTYIFGPGVCEAEWILKWENRP